jgi:hypothetical protein
MPERKDPDTRDGKLVRPGQEEIKVKIKDDGENLKKGEPSNHDKIEIVYISPKS